MSDSELPAELPLSQDIVTSALAGVLTGADCGRLGCQRSGGLSFEKSREGTLGLSFVFAPGEEDAVLSSVPPIEPAVRQAKSSSLTLL